MAFSHKMRFVACFGVGLLLAPVAWAQPAKPPAPPPEHPAIEPVALEILKVASARLAAAKAISFTAVTTYEHPARTGQPLYYTTLSEVVFQRPDKLRVITPGDGPPSEFYYDGKVIAAYAPAVDLVAVADAPGNLEAALKQAYESAAIYFPFAEILVADPFANLTEGLTSAFRVGQSKVVGDTVTDIVAFANDRVQAQIWIGVEDGLPRALRTVYPREPGQGRTEVQFSNWRLDGAVAPAEFSTPHASTSPRMTFARPDAPPPAPAKKP
jgi:hypothetical protein